MAVVRLLRGRSARHFLSAGSAKYLDFTVFHLNRENKWPQKALILTREN